MSRPSVQAALLLLLLVSARAKDTGEDAKMRAQEPKEPGLPPLHARDRRTPEEMEERRKASALFAALIEPKTPKEIQFPLTEEDEAKFHASREGLMEWVVSAARQHDLLNSEVRAQLRDKTKRNQQATREMLVQAVNKGATLQQVPPSACVRAPLCALLRALVVTALSPYASSHSIGEKQEASAIQFTVREGVRSPCSKRDTDRIWAASHVGAVSRWPPQNVSPCCTPAGACWAYYLAIRSTSGAGQGGCARKQQRAQG